MEFIRYINGIKIENNDLEKYKIYTPELESAVRDAGRRAYNGTEPLIKNIGERLNDKTEG